MAVKTQNRIFICKLFSEDLNFFFEKFIIFNATDHQSVHQHRNKKVLMSIKQREKIRKVRKRIAENFAVLKQERRDQQRFFISKLFEKSLGLMSSSSQFKFMWLCRFVRWQCVYVGISRSSKNPFLPTWLWVQRIFFTAKTQTNDSISIVRQRIESRASWGQFVDSYIAGSLSQ